MNITKANFLMSNTRFEFLPNDNIPEYAFIGRSNVGKSSLINMLVQRRGLAKTSSMPGKTVAINHFIVNDAWYLVDLPGYGYAQHSKKIREFRGGAIWFALLSSSIRALSRKTTTWASWNGWASIRCRSASSSPRLTRFRRPNWIGMSRLSRHGCWKIGKSCRPSSSLRRRKSKAATKFWTTLSNKTPKWLI